MPVRKAEASKSRVGVPALLLCVASASPAICATPCVTATPSCTEFVSVAQSPSKLLVYRSHALTTRNEQITTALIVVHGTGRNANDYFRSGIAAGFLAQALERTVI